MSVRVFGIAITIGLALLTVALPVDDAWAEKRVALAIGNSNYASVPKLPNPSRDAISVGQLFRDAGFDSVDVIVNVSNIEFKRAIRKFELNADQADIAVIFYAGHGLEISGTNYLIPVDAKLASDRDADDEAITLDRLVGSADGASKLRVIILDACRDNPFTSLMRRDRKNRVVSSGLGKAEPTSTDTLIAYAAKAGSTAEDGDGQHSPFTAAILKNLTVPGLDIRLAFGRVRDDVMRMTGSRQEPFVYGSLGGGNISFVPAPNTQETPLADIKADYELVAKIGTLRAWEVFLGTHKTGFYADLARVQIASLMEQQPSANPITRSRNDNNAAGKAPPGSAGTSGGEDKSVVAAVQPPSAGGVRDSPAPEALDWNRIKDSPDPAEFERFIQKYPNAPLALQAKKRLDLLRQAQRERESAQKAAEEVRIRAEHKKAEAEAAKIREEEERRAKALEAEQKAKAAEAERKAAEERKKAEQAERERAAAEAAAKRAAREAEEARKTAEQQAKQAACSSQRSMLDQIIAKGSAGSGIDDLQAFARTVTCEQISGRVTAALDKFRAEQAQREREAAQKAAEAARIEAQRKKAEAAAASKREEEERRAREVEAAERAKAAAAELAAVKKREEDERRAKAEQAEREAKAAEAKRKAEQAEQKGAREAEEARKTAEQQAKQAACSSQRSMLDQIIAKGSAGSGIDDLQAFARTVTCKQISGRVTAALDKFRAEQAQREREAAQKAAEAARIEAQRKKAEAAAASKREEEERRAREVEAAERAKAAAAELAAVKKREEDERRAKAEQAEREAKAAEAKRKAEQAEQERAAAEAAAQRAAAEKQAKEEERRAKAAEAEQKAKAAEAERLAAEEKRKAELAAQETVCKAEQAKLGEILAKGSEGSGIDDLNAFARSVTCAQLGAQIVRALHKFKAEAAERAAAMPNSPQLILAAKTELIRLGCSLTGKPDGVMNDETKAALVRFMTTKRRSADDLTVTRVLVADLTGETERICPLICKMNEVAKGDKCVARDKPAPAVTSRRKDDDNDTPARKKKSAEKRQAEKVPARRPPPSEPHARQQAIMRPTGGAVGGGSVTGVGF